MSPIQRTLALTCLAWAAVPAVLAGQVNVSFVDADGYADAGRSKAERESNLAALGSHLSSLGQRLPADTVLDIEVLEVDLAGIVRPSRRGTGDLRIARGGADWPRMVLRYSLVKGGQVSKADTERIADMNYSTYSSTDSTNPLRYEKRMLDNWFRDRFVDPVAATR